jgi:D-alanine transaminase
MTAALASPAKVFNAQVDATICLNGRLVAANEARVSVWDRGFLFGDAIYEVWRLYRGRLWIEDRHFARLERSLREIAIVNADLGGLRQRIAQTIDASGIKEGMVYIQITRGVAPRKHAFPVPPVEPTELIAVLPYDDGPTAQLRAEGATVISHPDIRWGRRDIKSTNLLANVLANQAAHEAGAIEAILVDAAGYITEATHSSLLWVRSGRIEGSPETFEILPGTTRSSVLDLIGELPLEFRTARIGLPELLACDEVFLTGTTIEVLPVVRVDDSTIGAGVPGPITQRLQTAFQRRLQRWLAEPPRRPHAS